ncbi:MAG: hypothetical protein ACRCX2_03850 [Paraclostridium sp.]
MIDINKVKQLELNKKYKYIEVCDILGEMKLTGNSKIYQLKELALYCNFHKENYKIVITEIFDEPKGDRITKGKADGSRNNEIYYEHIENIMLYVLNNAKDYKVQCSVPDALKLVNMVNDNYKLIRSNIPVASDVINIDSKFIYNFYDKTHKRLKTTFERSLKKMRSRALIDFQEVTMICKNVPDEELCVNSLGEVILNKKHLKHRQEHRIATAAERRLILEVEDEVLKELGHKDKQSVYIYGQWNKFKKEVEKELKLRGNISYYFEAYDIVINKKGISRAISESESLSNKSILNDKVIQNLNKSFKKANDKHETKCGFGSVLTSCKAEELPGFYGESVRLVDLLINDESESLHKDIKDCKFSKNKKKVVSEDNSEIPF